MAYNGNQVDWSNLNQSTQDKIEDMNVEVVDSLSSNATDKALSANQGMRLMQNIASVENNSIKKNVMNDSDSFNIGKYQGEKVYLIDQSYWKTDENSEILSISLPTDKFAGIIKATFTSIWGEGDASGGATVTYHIGKYGNNTTMNSFSIDSISNLFANIYRIRVPKITDKSIDIELVKSPLGNCPVVIKLEMQGHHDPDFGIFEILKNSTINIYDSGSSTGYGYPWEKQISDAFSKREAIDIVDGRDVKFGGKGINLATLKPFEFKDFLTEYLNNGMGQYKCFVNTPDLGVTAIEGYGVLTTTKPWRDGTGGGLYQHFETPHTIQKRFQIDDNTWSPWSVISTI